MCAAALHVLPAPRLPRKPAVLSKLLRWYGCKCNPISKHVLCISVQWQELVVGFREGMPRHRRRVKMKFYEECFTGSEAVQWLHEYLQTSGSFGTVSKQQV